MVLRMRPDRYENYEDNLQEEAVIENLDERRSGSQKKRARRPKGRLSFKSIIAALLFMAVAGGILFSPIFSAATINCTEMESLTKAEILDMAGISEGMNLFAIRFGSAKKKLEASPYIGSVSIKMSLPNTITLDIKERKVRGYVPYSGSYLYIDEYGRVLDVKKSFSEKLPLVTGLQFSSFKEGEQLHVENEKSFEIVVMMAQMMTKYDLLDMVVEVDVSDPDNIIAYINKIVVYLGDSSDCDMKIRTMAAIIEEIPEGDRGSVDLSDITKPWVFKYLT